MKHIINKIYSRIQFYYSAVLYQAVATIPGQEQSPVISQLFDPNQDLATFLNRAFKIAISVGAILAVLRIGWAGYLYIVKGSDLFHAKQEGRQVLQDVALGLLLLIAVYIILKQINPDILNLDAIKGFRQTQ